MLWHKRILVGDHVASLQGERRKAAADKNNFERMKGIKTSHKVLWASLPSSSWPGLKNNNVWKFNCYCFRLLVIFVKDKTQNSAQGNVVESKW